MHNIQPTVDYISIIIVSIAFLRRRISLSISLLMHENGKKSQLSRHQANGNTINEQILVE